MARHCTTFAPADEDEIVVACCTAAALKACALQAVAVLQHSNAYTCQVAGTKSAPLAALFTLQPHSTHTCHTHNMSQPPRSSWGLIELQVSAVH